MTYLTYYETHVERSTQFKGYLEIVYAYRVFIKLWMHAWLGKYQRRAKKWKKEYESAGFQIFYLLSLFLFVLSFTFPSR